MSNWDNTAGPAGDSVGQTSRSSAFRASARRHGVSDDAITRLLWSMEPAVYFDWKDPESVRPGDRVIGHIGGAPELPLDVAWEVGAIFVASFDLAALPRTLFDDGLPREGHLLLFTSSDAADGRALHIPPGTGTAVPPVPVPTEEELSFGSSHPVLDRWTMVASRDDAWDAHAWLIGEAYEGLRGDVEAEEGEWQAQLEAAVEEYAAKVGVRPAMVRSTDKLRGVQQNPHGSWDFCTDDFQRLREEAVLELRDGPERFDEVYDRAWRQLPEQPLLHLATFNLESLRYGWGEGEISWMISRDDLRAGRFDAVEFHWFG
ncbi:DUF1963 domain-containing protein [Streptomyces sp. GESEQ-13]|uniref:DUF1963 domain-containing protein n=1 Tax=Streptomyces sp. GESEQ-13 TaxID=2812654 RepID=UPI001B321058